MKVQRATGTKSATKMSLVRMDPGVFAIFVDLFFLQYMDVHVMGSTATSRRGVLLEYQTIRCRPTWILAVLVLFCSLLSYLSRTRH